jgi:hypothetical protein
MSVVRFGPKGPISGKEYYHPEYVVDPIQEDLEHYAAIGDIDSVNKLLEMGGGRSIHTALLYASIHGQVNLVKLFLPRASSSEIKEAFTWAAYHGEQAIVELFLQSGKVDNVDHAFKQAASNNHLSIVKQLYETGKVTPEGLKTAHDFITKHIWAPEIAEVLTYMKWGGK